jgi:hypothetical protein
MKIPFHLVKLRDEYRIVSECVKVMCKGKVGARWRRGPETKEHKNIAGRARGRGEVESEWIH